MGWILDALQRMCFVPGVCWVLLLEFQPTRNRLWIGGGPPRLRTFSDPAFDIFAELHEQKKRNEALLQLGNRLPCLVVLLKMKGHHFA